MHVRGSAPSLEGPPMPEELAASNLIQDIRIRSAECVTPEYEIPAHPAKLAMKDTSGTAAQPAMKRTRRRQHHPLLRYRPPGRRPLERLSDSATASGYSALSLCCCKSVMHCVSPAEALQRNKALQRRTYRSPSVHDSEFHHAREVLLRSPGCAYPSHVSTGKILRSTSERKKEQTCGSSKISGST